MSNEMVLNLNLVFLTTIRHRFSSEIMWLSRYSLWTIFQSCGYGILCLISGFTLQSYMLDVLDMDHDQDLERLYHYKISISWNILVTYINPSTNWSSISMWESKNWSLLLNWCHLRHVAARLSIRMRSAYIGRRMISLISWSSTCSVMLSVILFIIYFVQKNKTSQTFLSQHSFYIQVYY